MAQLVAANSVRECVDSRHVNKSSAENITSDMTERDTRLAQISDAIDVGIQMLESKEVNIAGLNGDNTNISCLNGVADNGLGCLSGQGIGTIGTWMSRIGDKDGALVGMNNFPEPGESYLLYRGIPLPKFDNGDAVLVGSGIERLCCD
jgi:hypothetical protein